MPKAKYPGKVRSDGSVSGKTTLLDYAVNQSQKGRFYKEAHPTPWRRHLGLKQDLYGTRSLRYGFVWRVSRTDRWSRKPPPSASTLWSRPICSAAALKSPGRASASPYSSLGVGGSRTKPPSWIGQRANGSSISNVV
jgi:hypothetical protein